MPKKQQVFAGIPATMEIDAGSAEDALTVPVTAVQGSFESGVVWLIRPDGSTEEHDVELGLTDGELVEITDGLDEGDMIMEFVPTSEPDGDEMMMHGR